MMNDPKNGSSRWERFAVKAGASIGISVWLVLAASTASAGSREVTEFSIPAGSPDPLMREGAEFARGLHPRAEILFWESESGTLSVSRVESTGVKCVVRSAADAKRLSSTYEAAAETGAGIARCWSASWVFQGECVGYESRGARGTDADVHVCALLVLL
jgi:hypothetical protein